VAPVFQRFTHRELLKLSLPKVSERWYLLKDTSQDTYVSIVNRSKRDRNGYGYISYPEVDAGRRGYAWRATNARYRRFYDIQREIRSLIVGKRTKVLERLELEAYTFNASNRTYVKAPTRTVKQIAKQIEKDLIIEKLKQ